MTSVDNFRIRWQQQLYKNLSSEGRRSLARLLHICPCNASNFYFIVNMFTLFFYLMVTNKVVYAYRFYRLHKDS